MGKISVGFAKYKKCDIIRKIETFGEIKWKKRKLQICGNEKCQRVIDGNWENNW